MTVSLWLPIGRANFFNWAADAELIERPGGTTRRCQAVNPDDIPQLQVSVMRRMLEVMPRSFGYDAEATCHMSPGQADVSRPVALVMTLSPATAQTPAPGTHGEPDFHAARFANDGLIAEGVERVNVTVDEDGHYTFVGELAEGANEHRARNAMQVHICQVFGGEFVVERLQDKQLHEGTAAIRRYNGLDPNTGERLTAARGALNFFELNLVVEGLCNESLLPAVFFEHIDFVTKWNRDPRGSSPVLRSIDALIRALSVNNDATTPPGQIDALRRFLSVTARESLQRLKWAVESVRRSLLDQMMDVLHRRTRFIQLNLGATKVLRTPELAEQATETQLRGYVILIAAKLPLVINLGDLADLAVRQLEERLRGAGEHHFATDEVRMQMDELVVQQRNWVMLLHSLQASVRGLNDAITHEWREKLLYEQEQTRSEQEAMAEIERSQRGRLDSRRLSDTAYSVIMLVLTILTVIYAIRGTTTTPVDHNQNWVEIVKDVWPFVWPVIAVVSIFYVVIPLIRLWRRSAKERRGESDTYGYELSVRLDDDADPRRIKQWLGRKGTKRIRHTRFRHLRLISRGSTRIERISVDIMHAKVHAVLTFKATLLRYTRFEIVNEIVIRRVAGKLQYFLRKSRIFGDSPRVLSHQDLLDLAVIILTEATEPLAVPDGTLNPKEILALARFDGEAG